MKNRSVYTGAGEDYFKRLSDQLILSYILDKISDAESLCMLSMVSRRMAWLVFQVKTVSIKIPTRRSSFIPHGDLSTFLDDVSADLSIFNDVSADLFTSSNNACVALEDANNPRKLINFLPTRVSTAIKTIRLAFKILPRYMNFCRLLSHREKFLSKFWSLRRLTVEADFFSNDDDYPIVDLKLSPKSWSILMARRVNVLNVDNSGSDSDSGSESDFEDVDVQGYEIISKDDCEAEDEVRELNRNLIKDLAMNVFPMIWSMEKLLKLLVSRRMFPNVVLVDSEKKNRKMVVGARDLAYLSSTNPRAIEKLFDEIPFTEDGHACRFARVLELPSSGRVMSTVFLLRYKNPDNIGRSSFPDDDDDDDDGFGEEEGEGEAYVRDAEMAMLSREVSSEEAW